MSVFKAYDIRGIYPTEINESLAFKIGQAMAKFLNPQNIVIGYDARPSSKVLFKALSNGLVHEGVQVTSIGMTGTEVLYFTVGDKNFDAGVMITASHNPQEYNGFKLVKKGAEPISKDDGILDIEKLVKSFEEPTNVMLSKKSDFNEYDPYPRFREQINTLVDLSNLPDLKVVVDAGNGTGGIVFNRIFKNTNLNVIPLFFEPDGTFPNHEANPTKQENLIAIKELVKKENADLGIALDGDGDRVVFIDDYGNDSVGYYIFALLIGQLLKKEPSATIVHENRLYWAINDVVKKYPMAKSIQSKAGHSFIKAKMRETNASMGGETSSHFFYKGMYYADSSMLTIGLVLEMIKHSNMSLRELLQDLKSKYFVSGEINFRVSDADDVISRIRRHYSELGFDIDEMDGIAFDKDRDWHVSIRKSNTEPLLRLNVEAKDEKLLDNIVVTMTNLINRYSQQS